MLIALISAAALGAITVGLMQPREERQPIRVRVREDDRRR